MRKSLKSLFCLGCGIVVLSLAGCGGGGNTPATVQEAKDFKGGGPMSPEVAAKVKGMMQNSGQPPAGASAPK